MKNMILVLLVVAIGIVGYICFKINGDLKHEKVMRSIRESEIRYEQLKDKLDIIGN